MALVKGTNSYLTLAEANAYFADRIDVDAWASASDGAKQQALVTAAAMLDDLSWTGTAVSGDQSMAFPRIGEYFDPKIGTIVELVSGEVPKRIENANADLAYHLLNNDGLLDDTGSAESIVIGEIQLSRVQAAKVVPGHVRRAIKPLLLNGGSNLWWRAN